MKIYYKNWYQIASMIKSHHLILKAKEKPNKFLETISRISLTNLKISIKSNINQKIDRREVRLKRLTIFIQSEKLWKKSIKN